MTALSNSASLIFVNASLSTEIVDNVSRMHALSVVVLLLLFKRVLLMA